MIYIYLAIALALTTAGGWVGYTFMDGKVVRAQAATALATETARLYAKSTAAEKAKEVIVTKYVKQIVQVPGELREIVKTITLESPPITCEAGTAALSGTFRLLHDRIAATASAAYATPSVVAGAAPSPLPVTVDELIEGITDNYAVCAENALKLKSLQEYVNAKDN